MPENDNCLTAEKIREITITCELFRNAEYALKSHSLNLTYQVYGQAQMAYRLHVISKKEFFELNEMLVRNGMNNPAANLN